MSDDVSSITRPDTPSRLDDERSAPDLRRRPVRRSTLTLVTVGVLLLLAVASLGSYALLWDGGEPDGLTLVIPEGSAATLDLPTIDSAIEVPTDLVFARGEVLTIRNDDSAANRAGPWVLAPGETLRMRFDTPGEYFYLCTVDEAESVTVTVIEGN
jgi:hypothetical protein